MKIFKTIAVLFAVLSLTLCGCRAPDENREKRQYEFFDCFDTVITVTLYGLDDDAQYESVSSLCHDKFMMYHEMFDIYNEYEGMNNLKTINDKAGGGGIEVAGDIISLLSKGKDAYYKTGGAVDISIGPLTGLWKRYRDKANEGYGALAVPTEKEISEAAALCDINGIEIDEENGTVRLLKAGMMIDVGAIAKGYAAEKVADALEDQGIYMYVIAAGGNVKAGRAPSGRSAWNIGIQSPFDEGGILGMVCSAEVSVVTSGDYQRYYDMGGIRYHHIIDPKTGMPARGNRSVSILCEDSFDADILSTALFIMPEEDGRDLIKTTYSADAIWVKENGEMHMTEGAAEVFQNID